MRAAQTDISLDEITKWLDLPEGSAVTAIIPQDERDIGHQRVRVMIHGNKLPFADYGSPVVFIRRDELRYALGELT